MHGTGAGNPVPLSSYGGLVTLADPSSIPEGASPRTYDTDYLVGSVGTRAGLTNVYNTVDAEVGPQPPTHASSTTWLNPNNIFLTDGSYTSQSPVNVANSLDLDTFAFDIPASTGITGILVTVTGYANAPSQVRAQLLVAGVPTGTAKTLDLGVTTTTLNFGALDDGWGAYLISDTLNAVNFGVRLSAVSTGFDAATVFLDYAAMTVGVSIGISSFQFVTTFTAQDGTVRNLSVDAAGNLYVENVTANPGVQVLVRTGITANSLCTAINGSDVEYLTFSDGFTGSDIPLQYTAKWIDRITQVGPGAPPVFTPTQATSNTFDITSITQNPPNSDITDPGHLSVLLQSAGPASTSPGNVITVYYSPSFYGGSPHPEAEDAVLKEAFNSGYPVYVYISGAVFGNGNYLVTSIGNAKPPGDIEHFRFYFTVQATSTAYQMVVEGAGQYQMSVATITMAVPVPGLTVGNDITVSGSSVPAWDATWPISRALNSASMAITNSVVVSGVATLSYTVISGDPPVAGELVTVSGTTNANGALNVSNATIVSSTGGTSGTFTLNIAVADYVGAPESGSATTAGTVFEFDPGLPLLGTTTDPIYGDATGGTITYVANTAQLIGTGTRQGTVFFIARSGYYTAPAPPVTFTCPENTTSIIASQIPIGPPNVIARVISFTEPGTNGVPGANFFTIPTPVDYYVLGVKYTATSLFIYDNVSTTATFTFTDDVLLNALAIDVYGYNLFNQIEIGDPGWVSKYSDRLAVGLCRNKIQNFNNLSFDGGYLPVQQDGQIFPLGWTNPDTYGDLVVSPKFGNAYYIKNTFDGNLAQAGLISQSAYQDAYKIPIININTTYSVRVSARIPSGLKTGMLVITLTANGITYGRYQLLFSDMDTHYDIHTGTLLTTEFQTVPTTLMLNVYAQDIIPDADVEIDRIDIYPTEIPILTTTEFLSYAGLPEQFDSVTGVVKSESENQQPINGAVVMYDTQYLLKGSLGGASMYSLQASPALEPADWAEPEVAQKSGSIGILAQTFGEQYITMANRNGYYVFVGGQPGKITQEIFQIWDAINWDYGYTIWTLNDIIHRRLFIGVPMPTPNFWLPYAPANPNPTTPNVILMCNYQGIDSGEMLRNEAQMHTTMFGTLNSVDMRRKWSIWQIPTPFANICETETNQEIYICGRNSRIYKLDELNETDDGAVIDSLYTTAGIAELTKRSQFAALGSFRVRWGYMVVQLESHGNIQITLYPNRLLQPTISPLPHFPLPPYPSGYNWWSVPGGVNPGSPSLNDCEFTLDFGASRTFFEFRENDGYGFSLSNFVIHGKKDVWNAVRGPKV